MRVIVDYQERCTHSEREPVQFGSWEETYDFDLLGVRVADEDEPTRYGQEGYLLPDGSTEAHVVWMQYSDGDSFGRAEGKGAIIGVWADRKLAEAALKTVHEKKDDFSIQVTDDFGREITLSNPGAGYFEHIDSINLDTYSLGSAPIRLKC